MYIKSWVCFLNCTYGYKLTYVIILLKWYWIISDLRKTENINLFRKLLIRIGLFIPKVTSWNPACAVVAGSYTYLAGCLWPLQDKYSFCSFCYKIFSHHCLLYSPLATRDVFWISFALGLLFGAQVYGCNVSPHPILHFTGGSKVLS